MVPCIGGKNAADADKILPSEEMFYNWPSEEDGSADAPVNRAHIYDIYDDIGASRDKDSGCGMSIVLVNVEGEKCRLVVESMQTNKMM